MPLRPLGLGGSGSTLASPFPSSVAGINLLNVSAAAGAQTSPAQSNDTAAVGLSMSLNWTAGGNGENLKVELQQQSAGDPTVWITVATFTVFAPATFATTSAALLIFPNGGESPTRRAVALPAVWRVKVTPSNLATAETFSLGATPIPGPGVS